MYIFMQKCDKLINLLKVFGTLFEKFPPLKKGILKFSEGTFFIQFHYKISNILNLDIFNLKF